MPASTHRQLREDNAEADSLASSPRWSDQQTTTVAALVPDGLEDDQALILGHRSAPVLAMDALRKLQDGSLYLETPPDPRSGATRLVLDPHEWIHRTTAHIANPRSHCQRFSARIPTGAESSAQPQADSPGAGAPAAEARDNADFSSEARSTWAA